MKKIDRETTSPIQLSELQRKILVYLCSRCSPRGPKFINGVKVSDIAAAVGGSARSIKTTICRLREVKMLTMTRFKNGRGGSSDYEIPGDIYGLIMDEERASHTIEKAPASASSEPADVDRFQDRIAVTILVPRLLHEQLSAAAYLDERNLHDQAVWGLRQYMASYAVTAPQDLARTDLAMAVFKQQISDAEDEFKNLPRLFDGKE